MGSRSRRHPLVLAAVLLLLSAVLAGGSLAAAPAAHAGKVKFKLRAKGVETPGKARVNGTLRLRKKYTKRGVKHRVVVTGKLDDRCPKDGYGVVLYVRLYFSSDADVSYMSDRAEDARGCGKRPRKFKMRTPWAKDAYKVELGVYEYDADTGDIARNDDHRVDWTVSQLGG